MQLNSVVLPDPLGPIRPQICSRPTSKDTPFSATTPPKRTATSRTLSKGDPETCDIKCIQEVEQADAGAWLPCPYAIPFTSPDRSPVRCGVILRLRKVTRPARVAGR